MSMVCGTSLSELGIHNGFIHCLLFLMWCASRRPIASPSVSVSLGSSHRVFLSWRPLALISLVAVLFCFALCYPSDSLGRFLLCEFSLRGVVFRVAWIYAPNNNPDRDAYLDEVSSHLDPSVPTLLAGDFNTVFDCAGDCLGSVVGDTSRESVVALGRLFDDSCCIDIWRYLHPSSSAFTWTKLDGSISSRIDLIGCPYVWVASVSACDIFPCPFSDHCAVSCSLTVPDAIPPGPGLWNVNTSVLEEDEYCRLITDFWTDWRDCKLCFSSLSKWWEAGKGKIKGLTVSYCVRRSRKASWSRDLLTRLAVHLKACLDAGCLSVLGVYWSTLEQLSAIDVAAAQGAQVRSHVQWVEEGEVLSAYFFRLEKKRSTD